MITEIRIKNYRSFKDASAKLSPFTLVIGANESGKSNFLRILRDSFFAQSKAKGDEREAPVQQILQTGALGERNRSFNRHGLVLDFSKHFDLESDQQEVHLDFGNNKGFSLENGVIAKISSYETDALPQLFSLNSEKVGQSENIIPNPKVSESGANVVSVLDSLKNGDREDIFDQIEQELCTYIPFIEKLFSKIDKAGSKRLFVREKGIKTVFPVADLSEGTRLLLTILTIVHQENAPPLILLEDLDRGLHPRLFGEVVEMLRKISNEREIQIIATTHNPYLLDQFAGDEGSVLIVERLNGESKITTLADRIEEGDIVDGALGELWYGGFVGGVPQR